MGSIVKTTPILVDPICESLKMDAQNMQNYSIDWHSAIDETATHAAPEVLAQAANAIAKWHAWQAPPQVVATDPLDRLEDIIRRLHEGFIRPSFYATNMNRFWKENLGKSLVLIRELYGTLRELELVPAEFILSILKDFQKELADRDDANEIVIRLANEHLQHTVSLARTNNSLLQTESGFTVRDYGLRLSVGIAKTFLAIMAIGTIDGFERMSYALRRGILEMLQEGYTGAYGVTFEQFVAYLSRNNDTASFIIEENLLQPLLNVILIVRQHFRLVQFLHISIMLDPYSDQPFIAISIALPLPIDEAARSYSEMTEALIRQIPDEQREKFNVFHRVSQ